MAFKPSYNTRAQNSAAYKNGKKRPLAQRILMGLFPVKGDDLREVLRKFAFLIALGCLIYFGGDIIYSLVNEQIQQGVNKNWTTNIFGDMNFDEETETNVREKVPEILPEFIVAYSKNNDLVGYISLPDITQPEVTPVIDYLVVQAEDNEYYLENTIEHVYSKGGSIFADYRNRFDPGVISANTVLYGHNIFGGGYFTSLSWFHSAHYVNSKNPTADALDYYKKHPVVQFDTIYEKSQWKIFAVVFANTQAEHGDVFDYTNSLEFRNVDEFNEFILETMDRSVLFADVDLTYGDNILTLSTCFYPMGDAIDTRCVVFARKVREGESAEVDTSKAVYNTAEYRFERQARSFGTNWAGRVWDTSYLLSY